MLLLARVHYKTWYKCQWFSLGTLNLRLFGAAGKGS